MLPDINSINNEANKDDVIAIQEIINTAIMGWNSGDAETCSKYIAEDCSFTNIIGAYDKGYKIFLNKHTKILKGVYLNTTMEQKIVNLQFIRPDVAIVDTLIRVSGVAKPIPLPGVYVNDNGFLHTRLCQVMVKDTIGWKVVAYHNVDVKPGVPVSEI